MPATQILHGGSISVDDYRCSAGPEDDPFVEVHGGFSVSYVRKGSFGYRVRGRSFDLVAGAIWSGIPATSKCAHTTMSWAMNACPFA